MNGSMVKEIIKKDGLPIEIVFTWEDVLVTFDISDGKPQKISEMRQSGRYNERIYIPKDPFKQMVKVAWGILASTKKKKDKERNQLALDI